MKGVRSFAIALVVLGTTAAGCSLDSEGIVSSGSAGPSADGGGQSDAGSGGDAIDDVGTIPDTGAENCGNGIDDDADGQIDCADSDCAPFECSPPLDAGWTVAAIVSATNGAPVGSCPAGWNQVAADLGESPTSAAATCACACSGNPCIGGTGAKVNWRSSGNSSCSDGTDAITSDGQCRAFSNLPNFYHNANITPPSVALPAACSDATTKPAIAFAATARTCASGVGTGGGCAATAVCVPKPGTGHACIRHDGDVACPQATMVKHVVGVKTDVTDSRACSACNCQTSTCTGETVGLFSDNQCNNKLFDATTGQCAALSTSDSSNIGYYRYRATAACAATATSNVTGSVTFTTPTTVCCPP